MMWRNESRSNKSYANFSLLAHAHSLWILVTVTPARRMPALRALLPVVSIALSRPAADSCGRYQMIKQRLNQAARALLREFWAKDSLGDCQTMSEVDDNRDEVIRFQFRGDFRRPHEVPDKLSSVANLL